MKVTKLFFHGIFLLWGCKVCGAFNRLCINWKGNDIHPDEWKQEDALQICIDVLTKKFNPVMICTRCKQEHKGVIYRVKPFGHKKMEKYWRDFKTLDKAWIKKALSSKRVTEFYLQPDYKPNARQRLLDRFRKRKERIAAHRNARLVNAKGANTKNGTKNRNRKKLSD